MRRWWPTAALLRACAVAAIGLVLAVVTGSPSAAVLAAPFAVLAAPALLRRPTSFPDLQTRVEHGSLHEGQGTRVLLSVQGGDDLEHVTRVATPTPYVASHPAGGRTGSLLEPGREHEREVSPRRWGPRRVGHERIWLTSPWAGYRLGPVEHLGQVLEVLPQQTAFDSRAEAPQPRGLVGAHRSAREASGSEFAGIRPFQPGDRLRRINWRVSTRTDRLHVTSSRAEDDAGLLLVVDALSDLGRSGGVDGAASSLDLAVRAAAALAEHHVLDGDRVGLRVVGLHGATVGFGAGRRHLRVVLGSLSAIRPGAPPERVLDGLRLLAGAGTTVVVLSPMLSAPLATATAAACRRGLPTLVVDTLPPALTGSELSHGDDPGSPGSLESPGSPAAGHLDAVRQAWRMRAIEREQVLASLAAVGCPVVAWRGPGTLDDVLRRLARRAAMPRPR